MSRKIIFEETENGLVFHNEGFNPYELVGIFESHTRIMVWELMKNCRLGEPPKTKNENDEI